MTKNKKQIAKAPSALQCRFWRAEDRMMAARVPEGDRDRSAPTEPVTVGGYYPAPTKSGRPAWARIEWRNGRMHETHCTYDPDTEKRVDDLVIAGADPFLVDQRQGSR
jgi:hypothetical protein